MREPLSSGGPLMVRINVTPIIDVALVLVIILLITAPMLTIADLDVNLPAAHSRDVEDQGYISVTLSKRGEIAVDDRIVPDVGSVREYLVARLRQNEDKETLVVVRADAGLPHSLVRQVLEEARSSGAARLAIATRQRGS